MLAKLGAKAARCQGYVATQEISCGKRKWWLVDRQVHSRGNTKDVLYGIPYPYLTRKDRSIDLLLPNATSDTHTALVAMTNTALDPHAQHNCTITECPVLR